MSHRDNLITLEHQIDQLIYHCAQLERENVALRNREAVWVRERNRLVEKQDVARTKVEAVIGRLRALEAQS